MSPSSADPSPSAPLSQRLSQSASRGTGCPAVVIGAALLQGAVPEEGTGRKRATSPAIQSAPSPLSSWGGSRSAGAGCGTGRPSGSWRAVSATCPPFSASSNPPRISSTSTSSDGAFCSASTPWALPSSSPRRCGNDFRAAIATTADGSRSMTASALTSSTGLCGGNLAPLRCIRSGPASHSQHSLAPTDRAAAPTRQLTDPAAHTPHPGDLPRPLP